MSQSDSKEGFMEVFQDYAYYYNSFYKEKDYRAEAGCVDKILKRYDARIKNLINFGCGTGKHDIELAELGYHCKGIDISPLMIDIAKKNASLAGNSFEFEVADIRDYTEEKKYDAVISLFHVMSYQITNDDILRAFKAARKVLNSVDKTGYFLFDAWYGPGVLNDPPAVRVKEIEDQENKLIRIARPVMHDKENRVDVHYEILIINKETNKVKTISEVHRMRYFFRPELEAFLAEAGFELLDNLDCRTLKETDYQSWTSYFIARAIQS